MKTFDENAARRGARVCTRQGYPARILCYDMKVEWRPIVALVEGKLGREMIFDYNRSGRHMPDENLGIDLMMADDDYLEKLERGEYGAPEQTVHAWQEARIMTTEQIAAQTFASPADESYWRKMYAGMAMQGLCAAHGTTKSAEHIARGAVECADAIIEELKK